MDFVHNPVAPIILVGVIVVLVGAILAFARSRKPKDAQLPPATPTQVPAEAAPEEPRESEAGESDQIRAGPIAGEETAAEGDASVEPASASEEEPAQEVEVPESIPSRMGRLRARLARSGALGKSLLSLLSRGDLSATDWEEIEDSLLIADLGLDATEELMEALRTRVKVENTSDPQVVRALLREELLKLVGPDMDRSVNLGVRDVDGVRGPATILMVGVNGTGKTTKFSLVRLILSAQLLPISLKPGEVAWVLALSVLSVRERIPHQLLLNRLKKAFVEAVTSSWWIRLVDFKRSLRSWMNLARLSALWKSTRP